MQFRSDNEIRVASTSGHVAIIGPQWQPLPAVLHAQAIAAGAEFDDGKRAGKIEKAKPSASENAVDQRTDLEVTRDAVKAVLAKNDPADLLPDGSPRVSAVSAAAGITVAKSDVQAVMNELRAEVEAENV